MSGTDTDDRPVRSIRIADTADIAGFLALLDDAVKWLCEHGSEGQWGSTPFSARESAVDRVTTWVRSGRVHLAEQDGTLLGAIALGPAPDYVPPTTVPEVYVVALVSGRDPAARGIGGRLLELAREFAVEQGVDRVRLDCWAGGEGRLIKYYQDRGFEPVETFDHHGWPGQILEQRLVSR
ncbi:GNAT family N-acetyltransferase [Actinoalloteichus fjordicus]|uniref:Acetyltransferase (GNAT) family protein n=1 Tax=Actinoalloteichus fjordicus TaxID=1612552 RepID=A0AAC9LBR0_9PSEU|nr:GNAT family N-acetyltransferase [Actinoalloteichus fjordicus]APU13409.1 acetyltransferase (GNAT) family protein [Actinoalloteichus fjordicus]